MICAFAAMAVVTLTDSAVWRNLLFDVTSSETTPEFNS
jgi:hypothetical protein